MESYPLSLNVALVSKQASKRTSRVVLIVLTDLEKSGIMRNICLSNKIEEHFELFMRTLRENIKES